MILAIEQCVNVNMFPLLFLAMLQQSILNGDVFVLLVSPLKHLQ